MSTLWKWLVAPFLIPVAMASVLESILGMSSISLTAHLTWAAAGIAAYLIFYVLMLGSSNLRFVEILEHEVIHAVVGIVATAQLRRLQVFPADNDNITEVEARRGINFWFYLAPYFLPLLTLPALVIYPFAQDPLRLGVAAMIGFTLGFHYIGVIREFGSRQTDIQKNTYLFSLAVTVMLNMFILMLVIAIVNDDLQILLSFVMRVGDRTAEIYEAGWTFVQQALTEIL